MWIAKRPLDLGTRKVQPGDPVPEAEGWPNRDSYVSVGDIESSSEPSVSPPPAPAILFVAQPPVLGSGATLEHGPHPLESGKKRR